VRTDTCTINQNGTEGMSITRGQASFREQTDMATLGNETTQLQEMFGGTWGIGFGNPTSAGSPMSGGLFSSTDASPPGSDDNQPINRSETVTWHPCCCDGQQPATPAVTVKYVISPNPYE